MVLDLSKISGIGDFTTKVELIKKPVQHNQKSVKRNQNPAKHEKKRTIYYKGDKAFLIENAHTIEVRCDDKLSQHLRSKYESVMESRYFGRGGIEIIPAGQLTSDEIADLIRLSYNLTK